MEHGTENSCPTIAPHFAILQVDMENSVAELIDELDWVNALPDEVAWVKVEPEGWMVINCFKGFLCRPEVKCDFCRVNFQSKLDAEAVEVV